MAEQSPGISTTTTLIRKPPSTTTPYARTAEKHCFFYHNSHFIALSSYIVHQIVAHLPKCTIWCVTKCHKFTKKPTKSTPRCTQIRAPPSTRGYHNLSKHNNRNPPPKSKHNTLHACNQWVSPNTTIPARSSSRCTQIQTQPTTKSYHNMPAHNNHIPPRKPYCNTPQACNQRPTAIQVSYLTLQTHYQFHTHKYRQPLSLHNKPRNIIKQSSTHPEAKKSCPTRNLNMLENPIKFKII